jgi:hypothetical protein
MKELLDHQISDGRNSCPYGTLRIYAGSISALRKRILAAISDTLELFRHFNDGCTASQLMILISFTESAVIPESDEMMESTFAGSLLSDGFESAPFASQCRQTAVRSSNGQVSRGFVGCRSCAARRPLWEDRSPDGVIDDGIIQPPHFNSQKDGTILMLISQSLPRRASPRVIEPRRRAGDAAHAAPHDRARTGFQEIGSKLSNSKLPLPRKCPFERRTQ